MIYIYYNKQLNVNLSLHDIGANYIFCLPVNTEKDHHAKKVVLLARKPWNPRVKTPPRWDLWMLIPPNTAASAFMIAPGGNCNLGLLLALSPKQSKKIC